jgi:hypothetical protein
MGFRFPKVGQARNCAVRIVDGASSCSLDTELALDSPHHRRHPTAHIVQVVASLATTWAMLLTSRDSSACPNCAVGREARAAFWSGTVVEPLLGMLVPVAVVLLLGWGMDRKRERTAT